MGARAQVAAPQPSLPRHPTGVGTAAARLVADLAAATGPDPAYVLTEWGDGTASPLYCPVLERDDEALGQEVDDRLVAWAEGCGFAEDVREQIRATGFGRQAMLVHPDTDDPDRLLIAAQMNAAWWAADDLYADDTELGAVPSELPPRLALVTAAMDPVAPAGEFSEPLEEAIRADRVLVALRSGMSHMARHAGPAQLQRVCYATSSMFVIWNTYAAWRHTGVYPPAWEYLAARQHDSFYTSMTLIDVVGGYELDAALFYQPDVRRALMQAGTAAVMVNDLYSVAKDAADENPVCNMVLQIAADRDCSIREATEATVELHNDLVRDFARSHAALRAAPSLELQRFLRGVRGWMAGGFAWHSTNPRYRS
ncbi:family 2 encapsulin nanocompartment cargo protein terpene cyclase [Pseudonocardia sp. CA-107938]|uniref:family 2 encapsulin nanocompartment cargo protein terpene cyclase n=1 Tax=Pseudonocardia sp. CA-107938 TaxID=3240021 RepID=UPI003D911E13